MAVLLGGLGAARRLGTRCFAAVTDRRRTSLPAWRGRDLPLVSEICNSQGAHGERFGADGQGS
jgi:hypothetical protein